MIDGAVNFRDLGGLKGADGRTVRRGMIYRSGTLHAVSDAGLARMSGLGLSVVFDLRSNSERQARSPRLPDDRQLTYVFLDHDRQTGSLFQELAEPGVGPEAAAERMRVIYRKLPYELREAYRMLFGQLLAGSLPLAFGCAAGKDRTGVAAMLLLSALGVDRGDIEADYLKTEAEFETLVAMFLSGPRGALVKGLDRSTWEPLLRTDVRYLSAAYESIAITSGSLEAYLAEELNVGTREISRLQEQLLE